MSYRRNKRNLPVGFKACPKCGGAGEVPCTGREYYQQQSYDWAEFLHGKVVLLPFFVGRREDKDRWTQVLGLAVKSVSPGGWGAVKVYISIDRSPNWGGFNLQRYGHDEPYDLVNGHKLYYIEKGWSSRKGVVQLENIPPEMEEIKRIVPTDRKLIEAGAAHRKEPSEGGAQ